MFHTWMACFGGRPTFNSCSLPPKSADRTRTASRAARPAPCSSGEAEDAPSGVTKVELMETLKKAGCMLTPTEQDERQSESVFQPRRGTESHPRAGGNWRINHMGWARISQTL